MAWCCNDHNAPVEIDMQVPDTTQSVAYSGFALWTKSTDCIVPADRLYPLVGAGQIDVHFQNQRHYTVMILCAVSMCWVSSTVLVRVRVCVCV